MLAGGIEKLHTNKKKLEISKELRALLDEENLERSIRRTQAEIADIIECNSFELFGTFTFSAEKVKDRYDDKEIYGVMSAWLSNQRRNSPEMRYLLVPERHKDNALHFHALLGSYGGFLSDSGKKWQGVPIFNLPAFKYGFTNFTAIRDKSKTANYCRKYITKELMQEKNRRRYWASKNLQRPLRIDNLDFKDITKYPIDIKNGTEYENEHVQTTIFPFKR